MILIVAILAPPVLDGRDLATQEGRALGRSEGALRARGLGSAWTTLHLRSEREVAEICGIPHDEYTQAGLFPIAYTIGTDFKPATRLDAAPLVHWNEW